MEIIEIGKIDNTLIEVTYEDESTKQFPVVTLNSRQEAIDKCVEYTKDALKLDNAFEKLNDFHNDFSRHRNYELESYLDSMSEKYYRIYEMCPFNGFMWFS